MLIQIDGWYGGGKSVLWSLLDNHKDVFVCPVHDYSFAHFLEHNDKEEWLSIKYPTVLRKILAKSEYYKFEKMFRDGVLPIHYSADVHDDINFKTDFYEFDKKFFNNLDSLDSWSLEHIVYLLYKSYREQHDAQYALKPYPKYYATMGYPSIYTKYVNIPSVFPHMKTIIVKRGLKNIITTRTNRKERPRDLNKAQAFRTPIDKIFNDNEIEKILHYFDECYKLEKLFPKNFLVVNFTDLISNTEETMKNVAKFLEIDFNKILLIPSRDGIELKYKGLSFIGVENDDYSKLLTKKEIALIDRREKIYNIFRKPYYILSIKNIFYNTVSLVKKTTKKFIKI